MRISEEAIRAQVKALREVLSSHEGAEIEPGIDMPVVTVPRESVIALLQHLRAMPGGYEHCSMLTAVDRIGEDPRFEVVYGLYSIASNRWVRVKTHCPETDACVPTVTGIWAGANWHERECYDMFGIKFTGHPDLRRILMPEGFEAHPLRKEYPRDGIEPDHLYREWEAGRTPVGSKEDDA